MDLLLVLLSLARNGCSQRVRYWRPPTSASVFVQNPLGGSQREARLDPSRRLMPSSRRIDSVATPMP